MRRYCLTIRNSVGYITLEGAHAKLTMMSTEMIVASEENLRSKLAAFLAEVKPFYALETGATKEEAEETTGRQKALSHSLQNFHRKSDLWEESKVVVGNEFWEITLYLDATF